MIERWSWSFGGDASYHALYVSTRLYPLAVLSRVIHRSSKKEHERDVSALAENFTSFSLMNNHNRENMDD